jgi:hypothetical protein
MLRSLGWRLHLRAVLRRRPHVVCWQGSPQTAVWVHNIGYGPRPGVHPSRSYRRPTPTDGSGVRDTRYQYGRHAASDGMSSLDVVAGAGFVPDSYSEMLPLVAARWVYAPAKQGARETRRIGLAA